jgi:class 3 adenylate cyclase
MCLIAAVIRLAGSALPDSGEVRGSACRLWDSAGVSAAAAAAPSGVVTFLFTDVEGSTRRWEADAHAMRAALVVHITVQF